MKFDHCKIRVNKQQLTSLINLLNTHKQTDKNLNAVFDQCEDKMIIFTRNEKGNNGIRKVYNGVTKHYNVKVERHVPIENFEPGDEIIIGSRVWEVDSIDLETKVLHVMIDHRIEIPNQGTIGKLYEKSLQGKEFIKVIEIVK